MPLYAQLVTDLQAAMKARDAARLSVLRMIKKSVDDERIAAGDGSREGEPADELVLRALKRYKKQMEDAAADFERGGRADAAAAARAEIAVAQSYLPQDMDDAAIDAVVAQTLAELGGERDFGRVMGAVMKRVGGGADGTRVKARVQAALGF